MFSVFRAFCGHQMKPQKTQKYAEILDRLPSDNLRTTCVEASKRIVLASFCVYLRFQRQIIEETVSGLFSGELSSEKMPRREDQNVKTKRVGWITP
jgi:hypothetical protein